MHMNEAQARKVVVAWAIETADPQGKLLSDAQRGHVDTEAVLAARKMNGPKKSEAAVASALQNRAELVLEAVEKSNPAMAALQHPSHWTPWLAWVIPLAALVLGVATDRVVDPHRVDLLSQPFLAIVLWNLVIYLMLLVSLFRSAPQVQAPSVGGLRWWSTGLWRLRPIPGALRAKVTEAFFRRWHALAAALIAQRIKRVLHLAAAAWAAGVALSLMSRGLVVAYGVGWESTFLNAEQVHLILQVLFTPMVALFSLEPFTVQDIARLQFVAGTGGDVVDGQRWVMLYAGLLALLVVVPRLVLAMFARWRERWLSKRLSLDLSEPYFQRLIDQLSPSQVVMGLVSHREEDRLALWRALQRHPGGAVGNRATLITTPVGDELCLQEMPLPGARASADHTGGPTPTQARSDGTLMGTLKRWMPGLSLLGDDADAQAGRDVDVVLRVVSQPDNLAPAQTTQAGISPPVLLLVRQATDPQTPATSLLALGRAWRQQHPQCVAVLDFNDFSHCWVQERVLLDAMAQQVPRSKAQGFGRLVVAWDTRNRLRFQSAMALMADELVYAASQSEEVQQTPMSLGSLISAADREAREQTNQTTSKAAMAAVLERLRQSDEKTLKSLLALHGLDASLSPELMHQLEAKFAVRTTVSAKQAGMAGAASGAAMGASIDLITGGLTLGAAAALGAVAGGGLALIGAAWKNRATPGGASTVQLSDDMMQALLEARLLRYLVMVHLQQGDADANGLVSAPELQDVWCSGVIAAVQSHEAPLLALWRAARSPSDAAGADTSRTLAHQLEEITEAVLRALYPAH